MKYSKKIATNICSLIKRDTFTIAEICEKVNIAERTFYQWQRENAEFAEIIAHARDQFDETLVKEAKNSLRKLINGYDVEEKTTVYVDSKGDNGESKPKIKEQKITKKHIQPNPNSIEFVLTNKAPEEYKNRQSTELTGKGGRDLFASLSDAELDARIAELEQKLHR